MLSISNVTPDQGANYFKQENYYSQEEAKEQSQWFGKGAAQFGLSGHVESEAFKNLLHGESPDGKKTLSGKKINPKKHRAGYDLTFSAPKSVSLAVLMGGHKQLEEAHRRAVERVLELIEQRYAQARVWDGKQQKHVNTGNLIVGQFHHTTSREKDPQLHTHCVILNCTQLENGKWRALSNEELYNNKMLLGAIYRNELAYEARKLGYEIESHTGELFEIFGYTQFQLEWFSKRRQQILELVGPNATAAQKEWANLQTRAKKGKELPREELLGWWQAQDEAFNLQIQHPIPQATAQPIQDATAATTAIKEAIEHCSERTVDFKRKVLEKFIFSEIKQFSYAELEIALVNDPELITTLDGHFTTQAAVTRELETIRLMQQGQGQLESVANTEIVGAYLENKTLTPGQQQAIAIAATTTNQFVGWQGVAGAGKTYALNEFRQIAQAQGYVLKGYAPSSEAAKVLGEEVSIESTTVASLIVSKQPEEIQLNQIWIVDEAGLLSAKDAYTLLQRATEAQARVILVGDTRQLSAVEAGNPFKSLQQAGMQTAHLNQSLRQRTKDLQAAVDLVAQGQVKQGIARLESANCIVVIPEAEQRLEQLVVDYMAVAPAEREATLVLAGTNQERLEITQRIRKELKAEGTLGQATKVTQLRPKDLTQVQARYTHHYKIGDVVVPTREYKRLGLTKFQPYQVEALDRNSLRLKATDGTQRTVDPMTFRKTVYTQQGIEIAVGERLKWTRNDQERARRNGQEFTVAALAGDTAQIQYQDGKTDNIHLNQLHHLDYALVSTTYSSQGKTASRVLVATDRTMSKESFYVAISRVKHELKIYTEDHAQLLELAQKSRAKNNPSDVLLSSPQTVAATTAAATAEVSSPHINKESTDERTQQPTESTQNPQQFQPGDGISIGRSVSERLNANSRTARPHRGLDSSPTTSGSRTTELRPGASHSAANQSGQRVERPVLRTQRVSEQWRGVGNNNHPLVTGARRPTSGNERPNTSSGGTTSAAKPAFYQSGAEARQPDRRIAALAQGNEQLKQDNEQLEYNNKQLKEPVQSGVTRLNQRFNQNARPAVTEGERPPGAVNNVDRSARGIDSSPSTAEPTARQLVGTDPPRASRRPAVEPRLTDAIQHIGTVHEQLGTARTSTRPTVEVVNYSDSEPERNSPEVVPSAEQFSSTSIQPTGELQQLSSNANHFNQHFQSAFGAAASEEATQQSDGATEQQPQQPRASYRQSTPGFDSHLQQLGRVSSQLRNSGASLADLNSMAAQLSLTTVASRLGLTPAGDHANRWQGAGVVVDINGDRFYNHQTQQQGGGAIAFIMQTRHWSYRQATNWLKHGSPAAQKTEQLPQSLPPQAQTSFTPPVKDEQQWTAVRRYLIQQRSLPAGLVDELHVAGKIYADRSGNAVFPQTAEQGRVTRANLLSVWSERSLPQLVQGSQPGDSWFQFSQGSGKLARIVLTESPLDAMSLAALEQGQHQHRSVYISIDKEQSIPTLQQFAAQGVAIEVAFGVDSESENKAQQILDLLSTATRRKPNQIQGWNVQLRQTRSRHASASSKQIPPVQQLDSKALILNAISQERAAYAYACKSDVKTAVLGLVAGRDRHEIEKDISSQSQLIKHWQVSERSPAVAIAKTNYYIDQLCAEAQTHPLYYQELYKRYVADIRDQEGNLPKEELDQKVALAATRVHSEETVKSILKHSLVSLLKGDEYIQQTLAQAKNQIQGQTQKASQEQQQKIHTSKQDIDFDHQA